jgi:nicotinate-nucleotide adenylyltransferase
LKIGVMGGTFDPIHNGHLVTSEEARCQFGLDKVLFIPSARPPHKREVKQSPFEDRYRMVELAVEGNAFLSVSLLEMERSGLSYTIDTLHELRLIHGKEVQLFFITGADAILEILTWKDPGEILAESELIAATRPGYPLERLKEALPEYNSHGEPVVERVHAMEIPALFISSTDIRERVREGRPFRYLVPEPVWEYIVEKRLYLER